MKVSTFKQTLLLTGENLVGNGWVGAEQLTAADVTNISFKLESDWTSVTILLLQLSRSLGQSGSKEYKSSFKEYMLVYKLLGRKGSTGTASECQMFQNIPEVLGSLCKLRQTMNTHAELIFLLTAMQALRSSPKDGSNYLVSNRNWEREQANYIAINFVMWVFFCVCVCTFCVF